MIMLCYQHIEEKFKSNKNRSDEIQKADEAFRTRGVKTEENKKQKNTHNS